MTTPANDVQSPNNGRPPVDVETPDFEEELSLRLWENYFERVESVVESLRSAARREVVRELKTHLMDSARHDEAEQESVRVFNAMDRLGAPEEFLEPLVTERIIEEGATTYNPIWVAKGIGRTLTSGVRQTLSGALFGLGYLLVLTVTSLAVLKPVFPEHVGLFHGTGAEGQGWAFGVIDQPAGTTELLGYWIIPLSLVLGVLGYTGLTKMLVILRGSGGR